jgi:hypothetical protein
MKKCKMHDESPCDTTELKQKMRTLVLGKAPYYAIFSKEFHNAIMFL